MLQTLHSNVTECHIVARGLREHIDSLSPQTSLHDRLTHDFLTPIVADLDTVVERFHKEVYYDLVERFSDDAPSEKEGLS